MPQNRKDHESAASGRQEHDGLVPGHHHQAHAQHIGVVAQVRDVHGDLHLTGAPTPAAVPVPRQLPRAVPDFVNRESEWAALGRAQTQAAEGSGTLVVVTGPGGVGKTALATGFLASAADVFGAGQLYADLRGAAHDGPPAPPGRVLDGLLRSLGTPPEALPADLAARAALWRSHTDGQRLAVLLDNASSAAQVRALLPGDGPHLVVVTTRWRLTGLIAEQARFIEVAPLDQAAATTLLARLLHGTPHATHAALGDLAHLCAGLPLALALAAAPLLLRPHTSLTTLIQRLREQRLHTLSALDMEEELSVTATFDTSYSALNEPAARLYRRVGWHPGPAFDTAAAAALADLPLSEAEQAITELFTAHLLEALAPDRYRLHDLARDHAQATSRNHDSAAERDQAIERMLDHYLTHAGAADLTLNPHRFRLALATFDAARAVTFDTRHAALQWVETELPTLAELVRLAHQTRRHDRSWRLCETLKGVLALAKHYDTWAQTCDLGLASAQALDDPEAEAFMRLMVGAHRRQAHRDHDAAMSHYREALRLWRSTGHRQGQASAYECLGSALAHSDPEQALTALTRSLDLHLELGNERGAAIQHRHLADTHRRAGHHPLALAHYDKALRFFHSIHDGYMTVRTLVGLAATRLQRSETDQAHAHAEEALTLAEQIGARHETANALVILADVARHRGDPSERDHLQRAHELFTQLVSPNAESTRERLSELDADDS